MCVSFYSVYGSVGVKHASTHGKCVTVIHVGESCESVKKMKMIHPFSASLPSRLFLNIQRESWDPPCSSEALFSLSFFLFYPSSFFSLTHAKTQVQTCPNIHRNSKGASVTQLPVRKQTAPYISHREQTLHYSCFDVWLCKPPSYPSQHTHTHTHAPPHTSHTKLFVCVCFFYFYLSGFVRPCVPINRSFHVFWF